MAILNIIVPDSIHTQGNIKAEVSKAIDDWSRRGTPLPTENATGSQTVRIQLKPRQALLINEVAASLRISPDELASRIVFSSFSNPIASSEKDFSNIMSGLNLVAYSEQIECDFNFQRAIEASNIGLVEASTGLGKTYVTAFRAINNSLEHRGRTLIAVPSVQLAHQTMATIERMRQAWPRAGKVSASILLGRQEFVWVEALESFLDEGNCKWSEPLKASVRNWISRGGKGVSEAYPAWTIEGLEQHAHKATGEEFHLHPAHRLDNAETCKFASPVHAAQFKNKSDISVITHMMLGRDLSSLAISGRKAVKAKPEFAEQGYESTIADPAHTPEWRQNIALENTIRLAALDEKEGKLAEWQHLILDEAHLFRANLTLSTSTDVSLLHLLRQMESLAALKRGLVKTDNLVRVRKILTTLRRWGELVTKLPGEDSTTNSIEGFQTVLQQLVDAIPDIAAADVPPPHANTLWKVRRAKSALQYALQTSGRENSHPSWSPVKQLPSIVVQSTETNIAQLLDLLWQHAKSSVLLSATLTTPEATGPSFAYIRRLLELHTRKDVMEFTPIVGAWLTTPVTLHLPARTNETLLPRKNSDDADWILAVTRQITKAAKSSERGILVLSCSNVTTKALRACLEDQNCPNPLIDSSGRQLTRAFREFTRTDHRMPPIWIAHGPAWTGLDIPSGNLDCLVIPRLPFRPPPQKDSKSGNWTFRYKNQEMTIRLRQGVGRLVRQRHLDATMHLWVLDPRAHNQMPKNALAVYKKRMAIMP